MNTQYISFHIEVPIRQVFSHHLIRHDAWWWDMYYNATTLIILCFFWHDPKLFLCHNAAAAAEEEPKSVLCILYCATSDYWEAFFSIEKLLLFPLTWGFNTCDFILLKILVYCNSATHKYITFLWNNGFFVLMHVCTYHLKWSKKLPNGIRLVTTFSNDNFLKSIGINRIAAFKGSVLSGVCDVRRSYVFEPSFCISNSSMNCIWIEMPSLLSRFWSW